MNSLSLFFSTYVADGERSVHDTAEEDLGRAGDDYGMPHTPSTFMREFFNPGTVIFHGCNSSNKV